MVEKELSIRQFSYRLAEQMSTQEELAQLDRGDAMAFATRGLQIGLQRKKYGICGVARFLRDRQTQEEIDIFPFEHLKGPMDALEAVHERARMIRDSKGFGEIV